jgi:hypothetical protein
MIMYMMQGIKEARATDGVMDTCRQELGEEEKEEWVGQKALDRQEREE